MARSEAERRLDAVHAQLSDIGDALQQGHVIEEDDALGRRIIDITLEISMITDLIHRDKTH